MADGPELGRLRVPVVADLEPFRRQAQRELKRAAEDAGKGAARAIGQGMGRSVAREFEAALDAAKAQFQRREREAREALSLRMVSQREFEKLGEDAANEFNGALRAQMDALHRQGLLSPSVMVETERLMKDGGFEAGDSWIDGLRRRIELREADIKEAQFRNLMTPEEAAEAGQQAAEEWNAAILDEIERRAKDGTLTDEMHIRLTSELRDTGRKGGDELGRGVQRGAREQLADLQRWLRGGFAVALVGVFASVVSRAGRMFSRLGRQIREVLDLGGTAQVQRRTFEAGATRMGESPAEVLEAMRRGMQGAASNLQLMEQANKALRSDLPLTAAAMEDLVVVARRLGDEAGVGAARGLETLIDGVSRGRAEMLQTLGIMTRQTDAIREWEQETGRSAQALSRQERIAIHFNAVLAEGLGKVEELGGEARDAGTPLEQLAAAWDNLRSSMAEAAANSPTVLGFLESIGDSATEQGERLRLAAAHFGAWVELSARAAEGGTGLARGVLGSAPVRWLGRRAAGMMGIGDFSEDWDTAVHEQMIRTETDLVRLMTWRLENLEEQEELLEGGVALDDKRIKRLQRQNELLKERIDAVRPVEAEEDEDVGPSEEELQAARVATDALSESMREFTLAGELGLEDLARASGEIRGALQELLGVQQQVEAAEQQLAEIRAAGLEVPPGAEAFLAHLREMRDTLRATASDLIEQWQRDLPAVVIEMQNSFGQRLPGALVRTEDGVHELTTLMTGLREQVEAVAEAERELTTARLAADPERIARAEERVKNARRALERDTAKLVRGLEASGIAGERLNGIIEELIELLREAGVEVEDLDESTSSMSDKLDQFAALARGVMAVADAMGALDNETRRTLDGVVNLAEGLTRVAASKGADIGGWAQTIGGVLQVFSSDRTEESQERVRQIEAMVNLRRAIESLEHAVVTDITVAERDRMRETGETILERGRGYTWRKQAGGLRGLLGGRNVRHLEDRDPDHQLAILGELMDMTADEVLEFLQDLGRTTGVDVWTSDGINLDALEAALADFPELDLWGDTLEGGLGRLDWTFSSVGDEALTAADRLDMFLGVLRDFGAADFADEFERILAEEGPEAAQEWLDALVLQMADDLSGLIGEGGLFEDMTPEEVQRILGRAGVFIEDGGVVSGTPETRMAVNITQAQGSELLRIGSTQLYHLAGMHQIMASMWGGDMPEYGVHAPDAVAPSSGSVDVGGVSVELNFPNVTVADEGALTAAGRAAGTAMGEAAAERIRAARRGRGSTGSTHYQTTVDR